jgi:hypothetical protein
VPDKSSVKVQPEILDIFFLGELHVVYMDRGGGGACFYSYGECDVDRLGSVSLYSPCLNQFRSAGRSVCSFCEAMAGSLSVANTAVSSV